MSNTFDMTWGLMISSVFSFSLLLAFSIISVLSSSVWCQQFSQQVSLFSWNQETSTSLQVYLIPDGIWHREMWWNCSRIVNFNNNSFFLNLYEEQLIRSIYHPEALACCSCAHWLGLPPGSPSPKYSRCFIIIFPHHPQYNYELHLLLGTKQSLKLYFSVTHGFVLTEYKL